MAEEQEKVSTVFKVVDESSGPLKQVAKTGAAAEKAIEKAKKAATKPAGPSWMQKLSAAERDQLKALREEKALAGAKQQLAGGKQKPQLTEEQALIKAQREERKARMARVKGLKLEEQDAGEIKEKTAEALGRVFGASNAFTNAISAAGQSAEQIGFQMTALGGAQSKLGQRLVDLGGKAAALAGAFSVGYGIGSLLEEHFQVSDKILKLFGQSTDRDIQQNNEKYAKSLGFATAAHYKEFSDLSSRNASSIRLAQRADEAAQKLAAMPTDATSEAMLVWKSQLLQQAKLITVPGESLEESARVLEEAASKSVPSLLAQANKNDRFNNAIEKASKGIMALPLNATAEEQEKFNNALATAAQGLSAFGDAPKIWDALKAKVDERGSFNNVFKEFQDTENLQAKMNMEAKAQLKHMKVLSEKQSAIHHFDVNRQMTELAGRAAGKLGLTPEQTKSYLSTLKDAYLDKQKKVFDFRGSKFDITQQFAQGFDPDRIAVAFTGDLGALGEKKLQSGLAPLYSIR